MRIVDDSFKEQQQRELELEMEEEQELKVFFSDSDHSKEIIHRMTSKYENTENNKEMIINIKSDQYLSQILPMNQNDDYQAGITSQREGVLTMENLHNLGVKEFLVQIL